MTASEPSAALATLQLFLIPLWSVLIAPEANGISSAVVGYPPASGGGAGGACSRPCTSSLGPVLLTRLKAHVRWSDVVLAETPLSGSGPRR
jgi:hypothetical protein